ncbi:succinyl-diaminopimelate desuccinylase [Sediminimonas sp.]|uniref:succinyl-diaminopimelate desuccinylase n=1 Tax=Sediminimonas sp. TaxID=2823379 RepID=UPI0025E74F8F|nr:succinyl-diaminopimelate desuccinylase [Sediminimonas sp.]
MPDIPPKPTDPVDLTARLVRCASVTPEEGGALVLLQEVLESAGFACARVDRCGVANLFARWGAKGHPRTFGFNGHTDVVPVGDRAAWSVDPFGAERRDGMLWGRGACDMKSGVAAFVAAAVDFVQQTPPDGAVILAITGDEEGEATHGTAALLDWMQAEGEAMAACLVGEPTCPERMGDMIKIGRRGSLSAWVTVTGVQGHSAYPHRANNPLPAMARLMDRLSSHALDRGTEHFDPSTLAVVTIDTGNPATNVIPAQTRATVNIRFNDTHTGASLSEWLRAEADRAAAEFGVTVDLEIKVSGESFLTPPGALSDLVARAVEAETGVAPVLSTTGGTSDARFVKDHCPVVEFGLVGQTMHQVDERVEIGQIEQLKAVYGRVLRDFFG